MSASKTISNGSSLRNNNAFLFRLGETKKVTYVGTITIGTTKATNIKIVVWVTIMAAFGTIGKIGCLICNQATHQIRKDQGMETTLTFLFKEGKSSLEHRLNC